MSFSITSGGQIIAVVSAGLALMSMVVRKMVVDQTKVKQQREEMQALQKEIKVVQKSGDTKLFNEKYGRLMEINSEMMKQSFKPMIFTLIPFLLIFGWLRGNFDATLTETVFVNPLPEGVKLSDLNVNNGGFYNESAGMFIWKMGSIESGNSSLLTASFTPPDGLDYSKPAVLYAKSASGAVLEPLESNKTEDFVFLKSVESQGNQIKITLFYNNSKSNIVATLGSFELGWFGWYFISSMIASMLLNKIFKVS